MTNEIRNTEEWTTTRGTELKVVSGLKLSKTINLDGHVSNVKCCEKFFEVTINGKHHDADCLSTRGYPRTNKGVTVYAEMGRLCLSSQTDVARVQALVAKTESHPAWVTKQELIAKNQKEIAKTDALRAANGYCQKCGSYCYGDCEGSK